MEENLEVGFGGLCAGMNYDVRDTGYLEDAIAGWSNRSEPHQIWLDDYQMELDDGRTNNFFDMPDFHVDVCHIHSNLNTMENNEISSKCPEEWSHRAMKQQQQQSPSSSLQSCMTFINPHVKEEDGGLKHYTACPFDMVKRGGIEGHTTLEDINFRLLMPPTRPIKHPVGDFAATAAGGASTGGFGVSGKAVVAFTKIHTQGRGTITVIRTT